MNPSCYTLSDAKKIPLTSFDGLQSKDLYIWCSNQKSWYSQEWEGLNPDCLGQSKLFSARFSKIELKITLSKISARMGSRE